MEEGNEMSCLGMIRFGVDITWRNAKEMSRL